MLGILFDLDGTLIDSIDVHFYSFLDALDAINIPKKQGVEEEFRAQVGKRFLDIVKTIYPDMGEERLAEIHRLKWEFTPKYVDRVRVFPHVYDTLDSLYGEYPLALVTSASRRFVDLVFNHTDPSLGRYFDAVVAAEDVINGKPDPEPYLLGAKRLNVDRAVVVGDAEYDRISAERAGFHFVHAREIGNLPGILEDIRNKNIY